MDSEGKKAALLRENLSKDKYFIPAGIAVVRLCLGCV